MRSAFLVALFLVLALFALEFSVGNKWKSLPSLPAGALLIRQQGHGTIFKNATGGKVSPGSSGVSSSTPPPITPTCLRANTTHTARLLLRDDLPLPKPIFNVGMPKIGSTTLHDFFNCSGYHTSHWGTTRHGPVGICMHNAIQAGKPPVASCDSWLRLHPRFNATVERMERGKHVEAITQMDFEAVPCYFPQITNLEELHRENPNATFVLNFRPVQDWFHSMERWWNMTDRLATCDILGLPTGVGYRPSEMGAWLCGHVQNVRAFVRAHPSHALVELNLYNRSQSAVTMARLFNSSEACWGHSNVGVKSSFATVGNGRRRMDRRHLFFDEFD